MRIIKLTFLCLRIFVAPELSAQNPAALTTARAIDAELVKLHDRVDDRDKAVAIQELARRIRLQPQQYAVGLAFNLAIEVSEASGPEALQDVTTTLADALRALSSTESDDSSYMRLAELDRYYGTHASLDTPAYHAAISKLVADDQHRSEADFTLSDIQGRKWNLKSLRGKVVMVNFWATWCPPCRKEIPDLNALSARFGRQGLVILAISNEEVPVLKRFLAHRHMRFPVLLDPGNSVRKLFRVRGIPHSFVYDRAGDLVAQAIDRPGRQGFLEMLGKAGLR